MNEHKCPECSKPMILVRVIRVLDDSPPLGAFYCRPCEFADTVPGADEPVVASGGGTFK